MIKWKTFYHNLTEKKMKKYDLNFYEALEVVMNNGAVKGENFRAGIFLKLNSQGQLVIVDVDMLCQEYTEVFIKPMLTQKFRSLDVFTKKELSY